MAGLATLSGGGLVKTLLDTADSPLDWAALRSSTGGRNFLVVVIGGGGGGTGGNNGSGGTATEFDTVGTTLTALGGSGGGTAGGVGFFCPTSIGTSTDKAAPYTAGFLFGSGGPAHSAGDLQGCFGEIKEREYIAPTGSPVFVVGAGGAGGTAMGGDNAGESGVQGAIIIYKIK